MIRGTAEVKLSIKAVIILTAIATMVVVGSILFFAFLLQQDVKAYEFICASGTLLSMALGLVAIGYAFKQSLSSERVAYDIAKAIAGIEGRIRENHSEIRTRLEDAAAIRALEKEAANGRLTAALVSDLKVATADGDFDVAGGVRHLVDTLELGRKVLSALGQRTSKEELPNGDWLVKPMAMSMREIRERLSMFGDCDISPEKLHSVLSYLIEKKLVVVFDGDDMTDSLAMYLLIQYDPWPVLD